MKKQMLSVVMIAALLAAAVPASASSLYYMDSQALQKFNQDTAELTKALVENERELASENAYQISDGGSPDVGKITVIESRIKELRAKLDAAAQKYGVRIVELQ